MTSATTTKKVSSKRAPRKLESSKEQAQRPIWEIATELAAQTPGAERSKIPHDGSINYKHYLHGYPKAKT